MHGAIDVSLRLTIPSLILLHLFAAPYTKVEESFNLQAIHDILIHGIPAPNHNASSFFKHYYDHVEYSGSVPRTFVGAILLSGISRPFVRFLHSPEQMQLLVRGVLGMANALALVRYRDAVDVAYGRVAGNWYLLFQATQFHIIYYASRTLPNMLAFAMTTEATRQIIMSLSSPRKTINRRRLALYGMTLAGVLFRSEIAILLAAQTGYLFLRHKSGTRQAFVTSTALPAGGLGLIMGLLITVPIDTFFWRASSFLWPELQGFIYNTVQGHASEWGVSPMHYYPTNAIPRLLLNPATFLVCIPLAFYTKSTRTMSLDIFIPPAIFVATYSLLPHKEWRFIIYVIPALTAIAAAGASWVWTRRSKVLLYKALSPLLVLSVFLSLLASLTLLYISTYNYPGAESLVHLHNSVETRLLSAHPKQSGVLNVYMDNLACQTGVTRFLQNYDGPDPSRRVNDTPLAEPSPVWRYEKTTDKTKLLDPIFWERFDYVITEDPGRIPGAWKIYDSILGLDGVSLRVVPDMSAQEVPGAPPEVLRPLSSFLNLKELYKGGLLWMQISGRFLQATILLQKRVTFGYWPRMRLEEKLFILVPADSPSYAS